MFINICLVHIFFFRPKILCLAFKCTALKLKRQIYYTVFIYPVKLHKKQKFSETTEINRKNKFCKIIGYNNLIYYNSFSFEFVVFFCNLTVFDHVFKNKL